MSVTLEQILAQVQVLSEKRDAASAAHTATISATENVTIVTTTQQSLIDSAVATYDVETRSAQASADAAATVEVTADIAEDEAFDTLVENLRSFKNEE